MEGQEAPSSGNVREDAVVGVDKVPVGAFGRSCEGDGLSWTGYDILASRDSVSFSLGLGLEWQLATSLKACWASIFTKPSAPT